mgnify:CR=1 FL=1
MFFSLLGVCRLPLEGLYFASCFPSLHAIHGYAITFALTLTQTAVGTGNVWRFARIVALNGGKEGAGFFLILWLLFLFIWAIPIIVLEYAAGRKGRRNLVWTHTHTHTYIYIHTFSLS